MNAASGGGKPADAERATHKVGIQLVEESAIRHSSDGVQKSSPRATFPTYPLYGILYIDIVRNASPSTIGRSGK